MPSLENCIDWEIEHNEENNECFGEQFAKNGNNKTFSHAFHSYF